MLTINKFVDEAREYYNTLPLENGIYKKYSVDIPLDISGSETAPANDGIEALADEISGKTRIRFDVIISDSFAKSASDAVTVIDSSKVDAKTLDAKLFKSSQDKLAAYANAKARYFVKINGRKGADTKLNILFLNNGNLPVQLLIVAEENSRLDILELYASVSSATAVVSPLHEITVMDGAHVEIDALHNENEKTYLVSLSKAKVGERAKLKMNFVYNGAVATKARNVIDSNGMKNAVEVTELAFGCEEQKFDLNTYIENSKPYSSATIDSGAALNGKSRCILKGYAKVDNGSKGAFSKITERGILLSKDAHIDALPDMAIDYSNEVKATHSAATAPIDQEALFYLTSRGIDEGVARKLFVTSFLTRYLLNMDNGIAKEVAMSLMLDKLERNVYGVISDVTPRGIWLASKSK